MLEVVLATAMGEGGGEGEGGGGRDSVLYNDIRDDGKGGGYNNDGDNRAV